MDADDFDLLNLVLDDQPEDSGYPTAVPPILASENRDSAPLSSSQERLWFLEKLQPGNDSYHIPFGFELAGDLDIERFKAAAQAIVDRHALLRCRFIESDAGPVQEISENVLLDVATEDLSHLSGIELQNTLQAHLQKSVAKPFNLQRPPLLRLDLISTGEQRHTVICVMHHLVSDGWSNGIFIEEMVRNYSSESDNLEPLEISYLDYAAWQKEQTQSEAYEEHLDFWTRYLDGLSDLPLPLDFSRKEVQEGREHKLSFELSEHLSGQLRRLREAHQITAFSLFLAGFVWTLSRFSQTHDVAVGTPVSGRNRRELEPLIGFFVNTLPLRFRLEKAQTLREVIEIVRSASLEAFSHDQIPFEKLVDHLKPERSTSHHPLVQAMFTLDGLQAPLELPELALTPLPNPEQAAKFELTLAMQDSEHGPYSGTLLYNASLLRASMASQFLQLFKHSLESFAAGLYVAISQVGSTLPEAHHALIERESIAATSALPQSIVPAIFEQIRTRREDLALSDDMGRFSYKQLGEYVSRFSQLLADKQVAKGSNIAIALERGRIQPAIALACWVHGCAFVSLDPRQPDERLKSLIQASSACAVFTTETLAEAWAEDRSLPVIFTADAAEAFPAQALDLPSIHADRPAYVIFTSGSTGQPKGVVVPHRALASLCAWHIEAFKVSESARATQIASPAFDASVWETWPYLVAGATLYYPDDSFLKLGGAAYIEWLKAHRITHSFAPTPLAEALIQDPTVATLELDALMAGGDRLHVYPPAELKAAFYNNYGPTENAVVATSGLVRPDGDDRQLPALGGPIANNRARVLDARLNPVPVGAIGMLYIGGESLASHYLDRPDLTASGFIPDPWATQPGDRLYRTGDMVRLDAEGQLHFVGRLDGQVKIRGHRIELGEIEKTLLAHPDVREAVVQAYLPAGAPISAKQLVAYLSGDLANIETVLSAWLSSRVPAYMIPSRWVYLDSLPKNTSGKVDRKALPEPATKIKTSTAAMTPSDETQRKIASVWSELLNLSPIGIDDNFFDLGAHSMLILEVHKRLAGTDYPQLKVVDLFTYPTVRALAQFLDPGTPSATRQKVDAARDRSSRQRDALKRRRSMPNRPARRS